MDVEGPSHDADHRKRLGECTGGLDRLEFTERHGGEAGVHLKGDRGAASGLAVGQSSILLAVAEKKLDLKAGFVIPVEGDGVEVDCGTEEEGAPFGARLGDDDDADVAFQMRQGDAGGVQGEGRVGERDAGKHGRIEDVPIDFARVATARAPSSIGSRIHVTRVGVRPQFADHLQV